MVDLIDSDCYYPDPKGCGVEDLTGQTREFLCSSDMDVTLTNQKFDMSGTVCRAGGSDFATEVPPVPATTVSCPCGAGRAGTDFATT